MATKEASNRSIEGTIVSASSSDLREMRAQRSYLVTKIVNYTSSREAPAPVGTYRFKRILTDIMKILIALCSKFTPNKGLTTCSSTQGHWPQDTTSKCKPENTDTEFCEHDAYFHLFNDLQKFILHDNKL